jgi:transcriptional regulator with XRE-family HTH domain
MAKPFKNLIDKMSQERHERIEDRAQGILLEMALQELRQSRQLTQQQLAEALNLNQAALSKMENQTDMHVSTLRRILSAMGATLKIVAQFPDGEVIINQFD